MTNPTPSGQRVRVKTTNAWLVTGWTQGGDDTTDGFIYFSRQEAEAAAQSITFGSPDIGVDAPGNVKSLQSFIYDGSALG